MLWDVFSLQNTVKTQYFSEDRAEEPSEQLIQQEYEGISSYSFLNTYVHQYIPLIAQAYGADISKPAATEGKYGTVGGKLITIGTSTESSSGNESNLTSSTTLTSNYSMPLLFTLVFALISFLFV